MKIELSHGQFLNIRKDKHTSLTLDNGEAKCLKIGEEVHLSRSGATHRGRVLSKISHHKWVGKTIVLIGDL